jgi:formylglycine-generating enzyme required for sulfatase activity/dienelactone hydrolase
MVGETVSHFRILEELGGGAMGVVYKAQDMRLKRLVALKFLPPGMTRDVEAKRRFVQEAEAASALDNPHVCTIHDIDETSDGRVFIAMGFYEGETLKKRLQRGAMPVTEVVTVAAQIARGLAAAHEAGIVHRDVKPANVIVTTRGEVKIVDFGIAKLADHGDLTGTGLSLGTVAYMAPELHEGRIDHRADLWALGVVIYEMLTGHLPFEAETQLATMNAVLNREPRSLLALRPDTPQPLVAIVEQALQKDPARRIATANDFVARLDALLAQTAAPAAAATTDTGVILRAVKRPVVALPALAIVSVVAYVLITMLLAQSRARWAREEAIPEILDLLKRDEYDKAYALSQEAGQYIPNDPMLTELIAQSTQMPALTTKPEGARVFVKPYTELQGEWQMIGTTPIKGTRLPRGAYRWRIDADGFERVEFARNVGDLIAPQPLALFPNDSVPPGMIGVPASRGPVDITGFATEDQVPLEPFFLDRTEVTNRQFQEFVDAGGYRTREYWTHPFVRDGRTLAWDEAMTVFRDSSGQPGPATWELGNFPDGRGDHPVTGVSWYEAAAYAEYRKAALPTIYHWARAALGFTRPAPIRGRIVEASNFDGAATVAVGSTGAIGPFGTYDMAGNVREWCWNESGSNRWILGGAWNDHEYMYMVPYSLPPFDRSPANGFRLARYSDRERVAELSKPIEVFRRDFREAKPVSDEIFEVFKRQFTYTPSPPDARVEATGASAAEWVREKVSLDTGYGERMAAYVFIPKSGRPPFQTAVFFPGLGAFVAQGSSQNLTPGMFDFLVKSGRIVVWPVWKGSFERFDGFVTLTGDRYFQTFRQRMREWRQEAGQLLDYLATRPDVDAAKFVYAGNSFGSSTALPVLTIETRFKVAVLTLAGFTYRDLLPEVDPVNFVPRLKIPVLMLEGRYDHLFPVELSQQPLLALLGSPADQKRQVLFDAGHGPLPRGQVIHETLTWLDRFLGPPQ